MQAECPKVNQMIRINNMLTILEVFIICLLIFLWNVVLLLLFIYYSVSDMILLDNDNPALLRSNEFE